METKRNVAVSTAPQYSLVEQGHPARTATSSNASSSANYTQRRRNFFIVWWREFVCCFLVVGTILAVVATVYPYRDRPLPAWPYGLSVNTLIAIYTVILKAALGFLVAQGLSQIKWFWFRQPRPLADLARYDQASRGGFFGPAAFLGGINFKSPNASLGALLVILSIIIDPFIQALVTFYPCQVPSHTQNASIPISHAYFFTTNDSSTHCGASCLTLPLQPQAAINDGFLNPGAVALPTFNCPSGNCTFPDLYTTVGYCSSCQDVTNEATWARSSEGYILTLPSKAFALPGAAGFTVSTTSSSSSSSSDTGITVELIEAYTTPNTTSSTWKPGQMGAARCNLRPCVRTYQSSIQGGKLQSTMVQANSTPSIWGSYGCRTLSTLDTACLNPAQQAAVRADGYSFDANTRWIPYNNSVSQVFANGSSSWCLGSWNATGDYSVATYVIDDKERYPPAQCLYAFDYTAVSSINSWLMNYLPGNVSFGPSSPIGGNPVSQSLWSMNKATVQSISSAFDSVSTAMTTYMQQHLSGAGLPENVNGIVSTETTCVRLRWEYLSYPIIIIALTLIFFIIMLLQTELGADKNDFKDSLFPLMYCGQDLAPLQATDRPQMDGVKHMEASADSIQVRFAKSQGRWKFE